MLILSTWMYSINNGSVIHTTLLPIFLPNSWHILTNNILASNSVPLLPIQCCYFPCIVAVKFQMLCYYFLSIHMVYLQLRFLFCSFCDCIRLCNLKHFLNNYQPQAYNYLAFSYLTSCKSLKQINDRRFTNV